jgi:hypothetical protein
VRYAQGATFGQDAYYIETDGIVVRLVIGEVLLGERAYSGLLARCYGFERVAKLCRVAELHLDEYYGVSLPDDKVYLAATGPVVTFDDLVSAADQITQRKVLTPRAG